MRFQVVDRDQRLVVDQRDGFRRGQTDDDAADQARPCGCGNAVQCAERDLRLAHRRGDDRIQRLDVGAGRDLRHDAAECCMFLDLREHDVRQDAAPPVLGPFDQGGSGFVAGGFDAEDDHRCIMTWRRASALRFSARPSI
jgi:hypothetical protein